MTLAEERRAKFNAEFGRMLGNKIGTTSQNFTDVSVQKGVFGYTNPKPLKSQSVKEEIDAAAREAQLLEIAKTGGNAEPKDNSIWGSFKGALGAVTPDFVGEILKPTLDIVSRPAYGVNEGLRNQQESINAGEPIWSLGDDFLWGAWKGITGERKTGFGDVVEETTKYNREGKSGWNKLAAGAWTDAPTGGEAIAQMETTNPEMAKWTKRLLGGLGDVITDPTTYASLGTAKVAKESIKAGIRSGVRRGTTQFGKDAVREVVETAARKAVVNTTVSALKVGRTTPTGMVAKSVNAVDDIVEKVLAQSDNLFYDVTHGAQKGKLIGGKESWRTLADKVSEDWRNIRLTSAEQHTNRFVDGLKGLKPRMSANQVAQLRRTDPLFEAFHAAFDKLPANTPIDKAIKVGTEAAAEVMEKETLEIFGRVMGGLEDQVLNVPTLRMFGQDIAYFPKLGKGIKAVGKKLEGTSLDRLSKAFNYTGNFPGYSSLVAQKARALGNREFEKFQLRVWEIAKGTTKADRKLIHQSIEDGITLSGPLAIKQQAVKDMYEEIFLSELSQGIRKNAAGTALPNYAYTYLKGNKKARDEFIDERARAIKDGTYKNFGSKEAARRGLRPTEDAFQNLLYRKIKSNRQLTRHFFNKDIASHYGIKGVMSTAEAERRGLSRIPMHEIPEDIRKTLKPSEGLYLDRDIRHIVDNYKDLSKVGSPEGEEWARQIDYVTRKFKTWNTVYYPGFHIRNFISDMYMGALDGVKTRTYSTVMNKYMKRNTSTLTVGGRTYPFNHILDLFDSNASSGGFLSAELGNQSKHATKGFVGTLTHPTSYASGVRKFSEKREDFGRFVHFYHALDGELTNALKKTKDVDRALAEAVNAATFRVNKYKFDYGALTKFEQKVMRRGVPFYTYMRKAIPTLAEAALMSPKNLSYTNKLYNSLFPEKSDEFDPLTMPDYLKEGFAMIPGFGNPGEPTGITKTFLPQNVFTDLFSNPMAMTNPLIRSGFELTSGKDTFTGKPVDNPGDIITNNIRLFGTHNKLNDPDISGAEKWGTILGIPVAKVSEKRQAQAIESIKFQIKANLKQLNEEAEKYGLKIYLSDGKAGTVIKIKRFDPANPEKSGSVLGEFASYQEAVDALNSMYK